jgi:stringent starvation protein B
MAEQVSTKQRPYLIRAMHEWMIDNGLTPHIVADASAPGIRVPEEHVKDGKIVLNVSYSATRALVLGNDEIAFEARFDGVSRQLNVPVPAVLGIYARETGQGMIFSADEPSPPGSTDNGPTSQRPSLKVVK